MKIIPMKLKRFGLTLIAYSLFYFPDAILADDKTSAYYWSGSIAAVCNLYKDDQLSAIYAKSYMNKIFPIIDEMPNKYKEITYNFFYEINDGSCRELAP